MIKVRTVIIGGGPAGTGILLKSMKDGNLEELLEGGIVIIEKGERLVAGNLTEYMVNSDTLSNVFLECLEGLSGKYMNLDNLISECNYLKGFSDRSIPLNCLKNYFNALAFQLELVLLKYENCHILKKSVAKEIIRFQNEEYSVVLTDGRVVKTKYIIIATGGSPIDILNVDSFSNSKFVKNGKKYFTSDSIIKGERDHLIHSISSGGKIGIFGGNHSAFSVCHYLLSKNLNNIEIEIFAKKKPKIYYESIEAALSDGYTDFSDSDFCPKTKRLYRLAGLRMDGRELYRNICGYANTLDITNVKFNVSDTDNIENLMELKKIDLAIIAFGYTFNMIPLLNEFGRIIPLLGLITRKWVDDKCRILDEKGSPIKGIFIIGLSSGYIPHEDSGGEPSFQGLTNGIWYYQNDTARLILDGIINKK